MPTEMRTAPSARSGQSWRRSSSVTRSPRRKTGARSFAVSPRAASLAPGLQKQPVRSEMRRALARASTARKSTIPPSGSSRLKAIVPPRRSVIVECGAGNALKIAGDVANVIVEDIGFFGVAAQSGKKFHAVSVSGADARFLRCGFSSDSLAGLSAGRDSQIALVNCVFESASDGVVATENARVIVQGGLSQNCARAAIAAKKDARLKVLRTLISGCGDGVKLSDTARAELSELQVSNCGAAIWLGANTAARIVGGVLNGNKQGVRVERGATAQISGTDARGNGGAWEIAVGAKASRENTRPV